jgi:YVTN family beta-propeller protein
MIYDSLAVINGVTNKISATIPVGSDLQAVAVNPATNILYVANSAGNSVSVISGVTNTVVSTLTVKTSPDSLVITTETGSAFVTGISGLEMITSAP